MNGIGYILNTFGMKQSDLARQLNLSRMTVSNWVNENKPVPENRSKEMVEKIPVFNKLKHDYFMKKVLSPSELLEIKIIYLHETDQVIQTDDMYVDSEGISHEFKGIKYKNQYNILELSRTKDILKEQEILIKKINYLIATDVCNLNVLKEVVSKLENNTKELV